MNINKPTEIMFLQKEDCTGSETSLKPKDLRTVKPTNKPYDTVIHHDDRTKGMDICTKMTLGHYLFEDQGLKNSWTSLSTRMTYWNR